jgi:hypothetical protein
MLRSFDELIIGPEERAEREGQDIMNWRLQRMKPKHGAVDSFGMFGQHPDITHHGNMATERVPCSRRIFSSSFLGWSCRNSNRMAE